MGRPDAMASSKTTGKPSSREGIASRSLAAIKEATSAR